MSQIVGFSRGRVPPPAGLRHPPGIHSGILRQISKGAALPRASVANRVTCRPFESDGEEHVT
jgi:hypothetical protein